ncbi:MAG: right-handed parallel beta-helix repeat-containing protein [Solirubrobacterales bacterium]
MTTIYYDSVTGDDTSSGAGGIEVTGTNCDATGGSNTFTLNETVDLSGFAAGDVFFTAGTTGERHLFSIASFTGGAATCTAIVTTEAVGATTISGAAWSVGGVRKTLRADTSREDHLDWAAAWTKEFADGGSFEVGVPITTWNDLPDETQLWRTGPGYASRARIWSSADKVIDFTVPEDNRWRCDGIHFDCSAASDETVELGSDDCRITFVDCEFSSTNHVALKLATGGSGIFEFLGGEVSGAGTIGMYLAIGVDCHWRFSRFRITNCDEPGMNINLSGARTSFVMDEVQIDGCGGSTYDGIYFDSAGGNAHAVWTNCTFVGNGRHGINFSRATLPDNTNILIENCRFESNDDHPVSFADATNGPLSAIIDTCSFWGNGTDAVEDGPTPTNTITPTADPSVNAAAGNFNLNNDANGGALLREAGVKLQ